MSQLVDYLLELASDPDRCARFKADPSAELSQTSLNQQEKAALASRDAKTISDAIADANPDSTAVFQWLLSQIKESSE
jgi:hypothetical protein